MSRHSDSLIGVKVAIALAAFLSLSPVVPQAFAQEKASQPEMTEGQFSMQLVKLMKLERLLPPAPSVYDHVSLLEQFGIAPLGGWKPKQNLSREDYVVILAFAAGKEKVVYEKAQEACDRNIEVINARWDLKRELEGKPVTLEELYKDSVYFPKGAPVCPYRKVYRDKNGDLKVERHKHEGYGLVKRKLAKKAKHE